MKLYEEKDSRLWWKARTEAFNYGRYIIEKLTVIKSPTIVDTFVTVLKELPKSLSGMSSETCKGEKEWVKEVARGGLLTFDLSKSGVSSVVVLIGGLVGENALMAPRDAEPTACADADEACEQNENENILIIVAHIVMFHHSKHNCTQILFGTLHFYTILQWRKQIESFRGVKVGGNC